MMEQEYSLYETESTELKISAYSRFALVRHATQHSGQTLKFIASGTREACEAAKRLMESGK